MWVYVASAAFVGFVHSISPAHWLPVIVLSKTRRWTLKQSLLGASTLATAHVAASLAIAGVGIYLGSQVARGYEEILNHSMGFGLIAFGAAYALWHLKRHSHCHHDDHAHHGPEAPEKQHSAFAFLFSLGLAPCVAALPIFVAAATHSTSSLIGAGVGFGVAVFAALVGATALVRAGVSKLDHPWIEHSADIITGVGIAFTGVLVLVVHQWFAHR